MMKRTIILLMLLCTALVGWAQGGNYRPMLVEGRIWNTIERESVWNEEKMIYEIGDTIYVSYKVDGSTAYNGKDCFSIKRTERWPNHSINESILYMYEQDKKVYQSYNVDWRLMFDYELNMGNRMFGISGPLLSQVDTISICNHEYRRSLFDDSPQHYCWIEGIGDISFGPVNMFTLPVFTESGYSSARINILSSVYDGDECIFSGEEYWKLISADVETIIASGIQISSTAFFDLHGRRLAAPPAKGVYIQGGRKRVAP